MSTNTYSIYVDGAAPNNQGGCIKGGIGIAVYNEDNDLIDTCSITINRATDNAELELITADTLLTNLYLLPFLALGIFGGKKVLHRVPQHLFEHPVLITAILAGLKLTFF